MFKDETKSSSLAKFLCDYDYAFVDTCSLMEDTFPEWMDVLVNAKEYLPEELHIVVVNKCVEELKKHSHNKHDNSVRISAKRALKILRRVKWKRILEFTKKIKNQNFADNVIYTTVSNLRITNRVLVITQDKSLATDLRNLNKLGSQKGRLVSVYKIIKDGKLAINYGESSYGKIQKSTDAVKRSAKQNNAAKPTSTEVKKEAVSLSPKQKDAISRDKDLNCKINNGNYPADKKVKDVNEQIAFLATLSSAEKNGIALFYSEEKLKAELVKLGVSSKPTPSKVETPNPTPAEKKKPANDKVAEPAPAKKLWYEYGETPEDAIVHVAEHHHIIIRDPSVSFVKGVHGDIDFTTADLAKVVSDIKGIEGKTSYKGMTFILVKAERGIKAMIDFEPVAPSKAAKEKTPKKAAPKAKVETPKVEEKKAEESSEKSTPKKSAKKQTPSKEESPKATLIVAVPEDEKTKKAIEKKTAPKAAKKAAKPTVQTEGDAVEVKPVVKKTAKKAEAKTEEASKEKPAPKTKAPKKADSPAKAEKVLPEEAIANDKALACNLTNPNYSVEKKKAAIAKQLELLKGVSVAKQKDLKYSAKALKEALAKLN